MTEEVIRYGAGGAPYRGRIGKHSTEADLTPPTSDESAEEEVKVELKVEEAVSYTHLTLPTNREV